MHEPVTIRRKRLYHQSRYRGFLESDLVLRRFAERHLADLNGPQLDRYESLLGEDDHDIYAWLTGQRPVPRAHDNDVFDLLKRCKLSEP